MSDESELEFDCSLWEVAGFTFDLSHEEDRELLDIALTALQDADKRGGLLD